MKAVQTFVLGVVLLISSLSFAADQFPTMPNPQMTPGALCDNPTEYRYSEHIPYCNRNVDSSLKKQIIADYDSQFGYSIEQMNRQDFKIDHFIPLSIGGANSKENLWPQHKSVYTVTDPLEQALSDKMVAGKITQAEAVRVIKEGKLNLDRVPELLDYVNGL
ncbi:MAG: hypothetical protein ACXVAX_05735 [Pseudobdellovibrio sp.]